MVGTRGDPGGDGGGTTEPLGMLDNKAVVSVVLAPVVVITGGGATKPSAAPDEAGAEEAVVLTIEGVGTTIGVTF